MLALGASLPIVGLGCRGDDKRPQQVPAPATKPKPRKLVVLFLSGGPDGVLTLDPKTPSEVEGWVDNPTHTESITAGNMRLGSLWAPLSKWAERMAIVHGVQVESANHFAGTWQFLRMRRRGLLSTPSIFDLIARHQQSPLGAVTVGHLFNRTYSPGWLALDGEVVGTSGAQGLSHFDSTPRDELAQLAAALRENARAPGLRPTDVQSYERVIAYLDTLQTVPPLELVPWKVPSGERMGPPITGMQRVLWALEHDLASTALVYFGFNKFDSHWKNLERQQSVNAAFTGAFDLFLQGLHAKRNQHGTLAEQTTILVAGEVGRFPRLNSDHGKDHFPEVSMLLMGAGIATGSKGNIVGQTGKNMLGLPMDLKTGKLGGTKHVMLDNVGSTLLRLFGIEPTQYGYPSQPIEPLLG